MDAAFVLLSHGQQHPVEPVFIRRHPRDVAAVSGEALEMLGKESRPKNMQCLGKVFSGKFFSEKLRRRVYDSPMPIEYRSNGIHPILYENN